MNIQGKRILVTGASGFIGSFIVEAALAAGAEVWAAVRKSSSRQWLKDPRINFIALNLNNYDELCNTLKNAGTFDGVIHCAGATKVARTEDFHRINCEGTHLLAKALLETQALRGRFVFLSSLSVMGESKDVPAPNSAYGKSKLAAEAALASINEKSDANKLDYIILRPTGVYGPREKDYFLMAKSIAQGVDFAVGYKPQIITFVYAKDVARAALLALTEGKSGEAYFLTDGGEYSSRAFSDLLQQEIGRKHVLHITAPLWILRLVCAVNGKIAALCGKSTTLNMDKYRTLAQRDWRCDIAATRTELGFEPEYSLERGVKESVEWYKENGWL